MGAHSLADGVLHRLDLVIGIRRPALRSALQLRFNPLLGVQSLLRSHNQPSVAWVRLVGRCQMPVVHDRGCLGYLLAHEEFQKAFAYIPGLFEHQLGFKPDLRGLGLFGSGEVRVEKRINVDIPAGVEDGARLRLKNQGPKGRGDLMVVIHIAPDRFFRREGLDVIGVVPINLAQALLGSRIKVKTLDGKRVVLRIPSGTQHGQKFRIAGHGIEKNGRRGDMYVEAHVTLPERLSAEEQEALRSFAEKTGMKY